jgi:hypothetical protein
MVVSHLTAAAGTVGQSAAPAPSTISMPDAALKIAGGGTYKAWTLTSLRPASSQPVAVASLFVDAGPGIFQSDDAGLTWKAAAGSDDAKKASLDLTTSPSTAGVVHGFGSMGPAQQRQKTPFTSFGGSGAQYFSLGADRVLKTWSSPANLSATGLKRAIGCIQTTCCNCPFRFDSGNTVRFPDGSLVISINVFYKPDHKIHGDGSSVVLFSSDAAGLNWQFRSNVATAETFQWSGEGPNESTISLLSDGKTLICIMRMDAGDGHTTGKPYAKRTSTDQVRASLHPLSR